MLKLLINIILLILISACASTQSTTPTVKYYILDAKPRALSHSLSKQLVKVDRIILPDYLNQPNLVMRMADQQMHIAAYHSWADNLPDSLQREISRSLNDKNNGYGFVKRCQNCGSLVIAVDHFYPSDQGEVLLAGSYELSLDGKQKHRHQYFFSSVIAEDGYDESVNKMRQLVAQLVNQINQNILVTPANSK